MNISQAVLGIVYSGDYLSFIREAVSIRSAYATFRVLLRYIMDSDAIGPDPAIDQDFRTGVLLGNGTLCLLLSLIPTASFKVMELFGVTGDSEMGLSMLMQAGKWKVGVKEPGIKPTEEGIRRPLCDMAILMFLLVLSSPVP
jgi:hypothetical protein